MQTKKTLHEEIKNSSLVKKIKSHKIYQKAKQQHSRLWNFFHDFEKKFLSGVHYVEVILLIIAIFLVTTFARQLSSMVESQPVDEIYYDISITQEERYDLQQQTERAIEQIRDAREQDYLRQLIIDEHIANERIQTYQQLLEGLKQLENDPSLSPEAINLIKESTTTISWTVTQRNVMNKQPHRNHNL